MDITLGQVYRYANNISFNVGLLVTHETPTYPTQVRVHSFLWASLDKSLSIHIYLHHHEGSTEIIILDEKQLHT